MGWGHRAARPLLAAALTVLTAGVVAATTLAGGVAVAAGPAGAPAAELAVVPAVSSEAVTIVLDAAVQITAPPTTAPPTSAPAAPPPPEPEATPPAAVAVAPPTAPPTTPPPATPPTTAAPAPPPTTAPPTTAAPAPAPAGVDTACEQRLFDRTNATRAANGLPALAFDSRPHQVARNWSAEMARMQRMAHNPNYGSQLSATGVQWTIAGENVGRGDVDQIFELWMQSPTHRRNLLEARYTAFAVACVRDAGGVWVTQDLYG